MKTHTLFIVSFLCFMLVVLMIPTEARIPITTSSSFPTPTSFDQSQNNSRLSPNSFVPTDSQNVEFIGQIGGNTYAVAVQDNYAYIGVGSRLVILNISVPSQLVVVGQTANTLSGVEYVTLVGNYAYVSGWDGLHIVDVSNPAAPTEVGFYDTSGIAYGVAVTGIYAYLGDGDGLRVVNVSNPTLPIEVGFYDAPGYVYDVAVAGNYAYVTAGEAGLRVVDVSNPATPTEVGFYDSPGYSGGVALAGSYAYVGDGYSGLRVVDVSNPAAPIEVGFYVAPGPVYSVAVSGYYAYISLNGLRVVDVSNPAAPIEIGFYIAPVGSNDVDVSGSHAYVAAEDAGLRVVDVSNPATPTEVGFYDTPGAIHGVALAGDYAYVADGYGLHVLNVFHPAVPIELGFYDTSGSAWDVFVVGNYAYVADWDKGLRVVDVSNPATPTEVGFYDTSGYADNVVVEGNYAYVADWGQGLRVVDISNPAAPTEVGFYDLSGIAGIDVDGNFVYIAAAEEGLRVVDVSNSALPIEVGFYDTLGEAVSVAVDGSNAYIADGIGLHVINVSDPTAPMEVEFYDTPGSARDVFVDRNFVYIAAAEEGLRVIDVSNPTTPTEVGFYDTMYTTRVTVAENIAYVNGGDGLTILRFIDSAECDNMDDSDGDALPNGWELCGYDHEGDGIIDVNLPAMGAHTQIPDVFLEIDYFAPEDLSHIHRPNSWAITNVVESFAQHGIRLHVDYGSESPMVYGDYSTWGNLSRSDILPEHSEYLAPIGQDNWKSIVLELMDENFVDYRRQIFHYTLFAHFIGGTFSNSTPGVSPGVPASYFVIAPGNTGDRIKHAVPFMHELGHNLGLCHGGPRDYYPDWDDCVNDDNKPNYLSVVNTIFGIAGLLKDGEMGFLNYSEYDNDIIPNLEEQHLSELHGLNAGGWISGFGTLHYCENDPNRPVRAWNANHRVDWDCDGFNFELDVQASINGNLDRTEVLVSHNDWNHLRFDGIGNIDNSSQEEEFTPNGNLIIPFNISLDASNLFVLSPGDNMTVPIIITNTGELTATVTFSQTQNYDWFDLSSIPETITLSPAESIQFPVGIEIPSTAMTGNFQDLNQSLNLIESPRMSNSFWIRARVGPMAWFSNSKLSGTAPHRVTFTDHSVGEITSWLWDFGDGNTSSEQNPTYTYTIPGSYSVQLTVSGPVGTDTESKENHILVHLSKVYLPVIIK